MTFSIPDDLAPEIRPLVWLVGRWQGFGMLSYEGIEERSIINELTIDHDGGPYLRAVSTIWEASSDGPVSHELPGREGYSLLTRGTQWSTETSYIRAVGQKDMEDGLTKLDLEVVTSDPAGHLYLWVGDALGPRVNLSTDAVISAPNASSVTAATRLYGLVQGDLLWAWDLAGFGQPLGSYASARLSRVEA